MSLSIIIPTYNERSYLPRLLASIRQQDYTDYEIIIADARSTDGTPELAKKNGCTVVKGGLPAKGRNNGAKAATKEMLLFMDADVIMPKGFLRDALKEFEKKRLDVAISPLVPLSERFVDKLMHSATNIFLRCMSHIRPMGGGCNGILIRRKDHERGGGFDEKLDLAEDHEYIRRKSQGKKFRMLTSTRLSVSVRRLDKEGRVNLARKYILATIKVLCGKKVTADEFDYNFEHRKKK